jgi:hypothetical protein
MSVTNIVIHLFTRVNNRLGQKSHHRQPGRFFWGLNCQLIRSDEKPPFHDLWDRWFQEPARALTITVTFSLVEFPLQARGFSRGVYD